MNRYLLLNKNLYEEKAIRRTILDFFHIAAIKLIEEADYWKCFFEHTKVSVDKTVYEFENYLIAISNQRGV